MGKLNKFLYNREQFWKDFHSKRANGNKKNKKLGLRNIVYSNQMGEITQDGIIVNKVYSSSPEKMKTCFVAEKNNAQILEDIFSITNDFADFSYLHKINVFRIDMIFEESSRHEDVKDLVRSIVNKTNRENKALLGSSKFYFLFDPLPGVAEALRFCNPNIYVVVIITGIHILEKFTLDNIDCLIHGINLAKGYDINRVRKVECFKKHSDIPFLIRKIVQEINSRDYEALLPILGFDGFHQTELINFDTTKFDILLKINENFKFLPNLNSSNQYSELANNITDLAVSEQVFYAYSNYLNRDKGLNLKDFISFSLKDGRRFYAK